MLSDMMRLGEEDTRAPATTWRRSETLRSFDGKRGSQRRERRQKSVRGCAKGPVSQGLIARPRDGTKVG